MNDRMENVGSKYLAEIQEMHKGTQKVVDVQRTIGPGDLDLDQHDSTFVKL